MVIPSAPDPPQLTEQLWSGFKGNFGWDVGANCGQSLPHLTRICAKVLAFEPNPESFEYLDDAWPHAPKLMLAVSDHDGLVNLVSLAGPQRDTGQYVTPDTNGMEWSPSNWDDIPKLLLRCRSLDSLAAEYGAPDFVKIDTEGHEAYVLAGAKLLLAMCATQWLIEFHTPENADECMDAFVNSSYTATIVRHPHYPPTSPMWRQHGWIRAFPS